MASEDTFNGARNAFSFCFAYMNAVAEDVGTDRATTHWTTTDQILGAAQGRKIKELSGLAELDLKTVSEMAMKTIDEGFGIDSEVVSESPTEVSLKIGRCPIYEAARTLGIEPDAIESLCRSGALTFMDSMVKQLNPNLRYDLKKFRSSEGDFCEETISLG